MDFKKCVASVAMAVLLTGCSTGSDNSVEYERLDVSLLKSCITDSRGAEENQMYEVQDTLDNLTGIEGAKGVYSISGDDTEPYLIMLYEVEDNSSEGVKEWVDVYCANLKDVTELTSQENYAIAQEVKVGEVEDYLLVVAHSDSKRIYSNIEDEVLVHIESLRAESSGR